MTEAEWLNLGNLRAALKHLRRQPGDRKLRLFLCGCCRGVWHHLGERCRAAVATAQRFADGLASEVELAAARAAAKEDRKCYGVYFAYAARPTFADIAGVAEALARFAAHRTLNPLEPSDPSRSEAEREFQRHLVSDLFGNPFRPVQIVSAWKTPLVVSFAATIYDEHRFEDLPILADALEDVGCDNADILAHCRGSGLHVRGCWVIDALLGKS